MTTAAKSTVCSQTVHYASECIDSLAAFEADEFDDIDVDSKSTANWVAQNSKNNIAYYVAGYVVLVHHCKNITKCF